MTRAITDPIIGELRSAGYAVALRDELSGVALRVTRGDLELVVRASCERTALVWVAQWLESRMKECSCER